MIRPIVISPRPIARACSRSSLAPNRLSRRAISRRYSRLTWAGEMSTLPTSATTLMLARLLMKSPTPQVRKLRISRPNNTLMTMEEEYLRMVSSMADFRGPYFPCRVRQVVGIPILARFSQATRGIIEAAGTGRNIGIPQARRISRQAVAGEEDLEAGDAPVLNSLC